MIIINQRYRVGVPVSESTVGRGIASEGPGV